MYFQDQHRLHIQYYDHCHSGGLTINHSHTQLQHYFLHLKPLQAVSLCAPYITATHKILYMLVALTNTTKQQETLSYTE
jgi:hypothetical protein